MTVDFGFFHPAPAISVEKSTNTVDADTGTGPELHIGDTVTWDYNITNTGTEALINIALSDDKEGVITTCPQTTLALGASMVCTKTGTVTDLGVYENNATVTADGNVTGTQVTDADPSHYHVEAVSLGSVVWSDTNNNGLQNAGESGISGAVVTLLNSDGSVYDSNTSQAGIQPLSVTTAGDGKYLFDNLPEGDYKVQVDMSAVAGYTPAANQNTNADDDVDNDTNIATEDTVNKRYTSGTVTLNGGTEPTEANGLANTDDADDAAETNGNMTVDFGFYLPSVHIGNLIWIENDNDNNPTTGDITYPPAGTVVTATASDGTIYTGATDANGRYDIEVPVNDTYVVTVETPSGTVPTIGSGDNAVPDDASEDNQSHDGKGTTVVVNTSDNLTLDFGFTTRYHIGTHFWIDGSNGGENDGIYQEGVETPIAEARVELLDENDSKLYWTDETNTTLTSTPTDYPAETTTSLTGEYGFDVPEGSYRVRFTIPQDLTDKGYDFVDQGSNTDDSINENVANNQGITQEVTVGPNHKTEDLTLDGAVNCGCADIVSDSADALGIFGMLLMILGTAIAGLLFIRREELSI